MFGLGEPPLTQMDWRFTLLRFPVRVHPYFWIATLLMGASGSRDGQTALIWVAVCFVSILIHELGHAFAYRAFGTESHIVLHSFGGLCIADEGFTRWDYRRREDSPRNQIIISAAGPGAGFLFAAVVVAFVYLSALTQEVYTPLHFVLDLPFWRFDRQYADWLGDYGTTAIHFLLFINVFWGLVNLLPILPLDGGRISHQLFILADFDDPQRAAHQLSVVAAIGMAIWGAVRQDWFVAIMFGILAYQNYAAQQSYTYGDRGPW